MVDTNGTLVFVTVSLGEAKEPGVPKQRFASEIWVRTNGGDYVSGSLGTLRVQDSHLLGAVNRDKAFPLPAVQHGRRLVQGARYEDVTEGVILSSDQKGLEYGVKVAGQWKYRSLDLRPEQLK
jgi:hypothetical protein